MTPQRPDEAADYACQQLESPHSQIRERGDGLHLAESVDVVNRYGTYDDLARIKEWSAAGGLGIEEW